MCRNCHRFLAVMALILGLIAVRSFGEVPVVENPAGKLGLAKPATQSTAVSNIGQSPSQAAAIPVAAVSTDTSIDDSSSFFSLDSLWEVLLIILLVSGVGILLRKMEKEP